MTDNAILEQIKMIQAVAKKASQSKEFAIKFLTDAGIIDKKKNTAPLKKQKI